MRTRKCALVTSTKGTPPFSGHVPNSIDVQTVRESVRRARGSEG